MTTQSTGWKGQSTFIGRKCIPVCPYAISFSEKLIQMKKQNKCKPLLLSSSTVILLSSTIFVHLVCQLAYATSATDTLLPGQSLRGNQALVSKDGSFRLSLNWLSPPFGIWFTNSMCDKLVWEPDANYPIGDPQSLSLTLSEDGTLQLLSNGSHLWSTHYVKETSISVVLVLLDIGNLVIRDKTNDSMVLWQSFDYPSDTILPGGGLGFNKIIGKNISLRSSDYYSTLEIDTRKNRGFIIRYIPCGWMFAGTFPSWMKFHEDGTSFLTFNNAQTYLSFDGLYISLNKLGECNYGSNNLWFYPENYFEYCGPYGHSCSSECECPLDNYKRYRVREHGIWGCSRLVPINCAKMMFYRIDGIDSFPDSPQFLTVRSIAECEAVCSSNCSCTAYAYDVTCLLWYGELWNATKQGSGSVGRHIHTCWPTRNKY